MRLAPGTRCALGLAAALAVSSATAQAKTAAPALPWTFVFWRLGIE